MKRLKAVSGIIFAVGIWVLIGLHYFSGDILKAIFWMLMEISLSLGYLYKIKEA